MPATYDMASSVADNVPAILVYLDAELNIRFANRHCYEILGYAPREILDRSLAEVMDPGTLKYVRRHAGELERGNGAPFECVLRHKNGSPRYLKVQATSDRDAQGRSIGYFACTSDSSSERATHAALRVAQKRLGLALDAAEVGIWEWDLVAHREFYSRSFQALLGYGEAQFPAQFEFLAQLHPEDAEATLDAAAAAFEEGRTFDREFRIRCADGSYVWLRGVGRACRDPRTGALAGCAGAVRDVSTRKHAEQQLRNARAVLHAVLERAGCAVISTDPQGRILEFNGGAERMLGLAADAVVGKMNIDDFRLDPAQLSLVTLPDNGGYIVIGLDPARYGADVSGLALLAKAGHELRTPLASVIAALELLREGLGGRLDVSAENIVGLALQNADRLERWINRLLELERIELDGAPARVRPS